MVLNDAEVAMILAIFFAMVAAQKHDLHKLPELQRQREETWFPLDRIFRGRRWKHTS